MTKHTIQILTFILMMLFILCFVNGASTTFDMSFKNDTINFLEEPLVIILHRITGEEQQFILEITNSNQSKILTTKWTISGSRGARKFNGKIDEEYIPNGVYFAHLKYPDGRMATSAEQFTVNYELDELEITEEELLSLYPPQKTIKIQVSKDTNIGESESVIITEEKFSQKSLSPTDFEIKKIINIIDLNIQIEDAYFYKKNKYLMEQASLSGEETAVFNYLSLNPILTQTSLSKRKTIQLEKVFNKSILTQLETKGLLIKRAIFLKVTANLNNLETLDENFETEFSLTDKRLFSPLGTINFTIGFFKNKKNVLKYQQLGEKPVFLISNSNWKNILPLVPITTWSGEETLCNRGYALSKDLCVYPTLIFHKEAQDEDLSGTSKGLDADSIIYFLQQYGADSILFIGDLSKELKSLLELKSPFGAEIMKSNISTIYPEDYFSYWETYETIIYVDDDYALSLLASTYASLTNSPLIIKGSDLDNPKNFLGKKIICVGTDPTNDFSCSENYTLEQLQDEYLKRTKTKKIMLVNPTDINFSISNSLKKDIKTTQISKSTSDSFSFTINLNSIPLEDYTQKGAVVKIQNIDFDPSCRKGLFLNKKTYYTINGKKYSERQPYKSLKFGILKKNVFTDIIAEVPNNKIFDVTVHIEGCNFIYSKGNSPDIFVDGVKDNTGSNIGTTNFTTISGFEYSFIKKEQKENITPLEPERSKGKILDLYSKTSLVAPFLASAKKEILFFTHTSDYNIVDNDLTSQFLKIYDFNIEDFSDRTCLYSEFCTIGLETGAKYTESIGNSISFTIDLTGDSKFEEYSKNGVDIDFKGIRSTEIFRNATITTLGNTHEKVAGFGNNSKFFTDQRNFSLYGTRIYPSEKVFDVKIEIEKGKIIIDEDSYITLDWKKFRNILSEEVKNSRIITVDDYYAEAEKTVEFEFKKHDERISFRLIRVIENINGRDDYAFGILENENYIWGEYYNEFSGHYRSKGDIEVEETDKKIKIKLTPNKRTRIKSVSLLNMFKEPVYLTIFASPEAIDISEDLPSQGFRKTLEGHYIELHKDSTMGFYTGRIFGFTTSDVSSYVARDLFFDRLPKEKNASFLIKGSDEKWDVEMVKQQVHTEEYWGKNNKYVYDPFLDGVFSCYSYNDPVIGCLTQNEAAQKSYLETYYTHYNDHGQIFGLSDLVETKHLKNKTLPPKTIVAMACSTCDFTAGKLYPNGLFCMQNIRRGALIYYGTISKAFGLSSMLTNMSPYFIKKRNTAGEAAMNTFGLDPYYYVLIGDPTFRPIYWESLAEGVS
jgi:hypothetical protein